MAIPPEFQYANEDEFTQRFLIPLLQRLGFSLVINYHGHAEFGKDLIFAELDRFGHIRYHGLQSKYVSSISLNEIESLIADCRQAFSNPFTHPQTGTIERISSFYAINGGSIGTEAIQHYFNSLVPAYGGNARLLQSKDLLTLDRWASLNKTADVIAVVTGLRIELNYNQSIASLWISALQGKLNGKETSWPVVRLKKDSVSTHLMQPFLQNFINTDNVFNYWQLCDVCNRIFDAITPGRGFGPSNKDDVMQACLDRLTSGNRLITSILSALDQTQRMLGPLVTL